MAGSVQASAETLITIADDPKHLGARIGITSVLHSWGSAMTHHPHVHMIVPGRRHHSLDGERWVASRPGFLPTLVRVLSRLFRRLFLERLLAAHHRLKFFGCHAALTDARAFAAWLAPLRWVNRMEGHVYRQASVRRRWPTGRAGLSVARYTHRVAIANDSRLIARCDLQRRDASDGRTTALKVASARRS